MEEEDKFECDNFACCFVFQDNWFPSFDKVFHARSTARVSLSPLTAADTMQVGHARFVLDQFPFCID